MPLDFEKMTGEVVAAARGFVERAMVGLGKRVDEIEALVLAMPTPKDGKDGVDGKDGRDGVDGKDGEPGKDGAPGKDGRDGIDGKDGANGLDGKDGVPGANGKDGEKGLDGRDGRDGLSGVPGKDGAPGLDGKDGFGLEDFDVALAEDGRTFVFRFVRGEVAVERQVKTAIPLHKGIWREAEYERGDMVTRDGSTWHCEATTTETPGNGATNWRLVVKRGNHGRDGKDGAQGIQGKEGRPGRDLTQMTFDGAKY